MAKWTIIAVIAIVAVALTVHYRLLTDREVIPYSDASDALLYSVFMQNFISDTVHNHHELPLWNPYLWSGSPINGNAQAAVYYPPTWLFVVLPFVLATKLYYILHTIIAGVLMYFLARELRLHRIPSMIAAVIFMTTGVVYSFNVHHFFSNFILWLPGAILLYKMAVRKHNHVYAVLAGAFIAIQFMGSHPQLFFYSMLYVFAFCIVDVYGRWKLDKSIRGLLQHGRYVLIAAVIAGGLAAFQIAAVLEYSAISTRINTGGLSFAAEISLAPDELLSLFIHPIMGGGGILFIGILPMFLAQASIFGRKSRETRFFLIAAVVSLLFALGKYSPIFYIFYYAVPGFRMFRNPYYAVFFFGLSLTILSGYGAQYLFIELPKTATDRVTIRRLYTKVAASSGVLIILIIAHFVARRPLTVLYERLVIDRGNCSASNLVGNIHFRTGINMLLLGIFALISTSILVLLKHRNSIAASKTLRIALMCLLTIELLSANTMSLETEDPEKVLGRNDLIDFLEHNGSGQRVLNMGGDRILNQTLAAKYHIELADGYDPMMLNDYQLFTNSAADIDITTASTKLKLTDKDVDQIKRWRPLDLLAVKYILTTREVEETKLVLAARYEDIEMYCHNLGVMNIPSIFVYENPDAFPRVYLTSDVKAVSREEILSGLNTCETEDVALVEDDIPGTLDYRSGVARVKSYSPNRIAVKAELDGSGLLVLSEIWYPGWKAFVDGEETEVIRTNYLLRGVYLGPGLHNVELLFRPASWLYGRYVALITMVLSVVLIVSRLLRRRTKLEDPVHNR